MAEPDLSLNPRMDCLCGGDCPLSRRVGLHAKRCQVCWRDGLPCIRWNAKATRWTCGKCAAGLLQPSAAKGIPEAAEALL